MPVLIQTVNLNLRSLHFTSAVLSAFYLGLIHIQLAFSSAQLPGAGVRFTSGFTSLQWYLVVFYRAFEFYRNTWFSLLPVKRALIIVLYVCISRQLSLHCLCLRLYVMHCVWGLKLCMCFGSENQLLVWLCYMAVSIFFLRYFQKEDFFSQTSQK